MGGRNKIRGSKRVHIYMIRVRGTEMAVKTGRTGHFGPGFGKREPHTRPRGLGNQKYGRVRRAQS